MASKCNKFVPNIFNKSKCQHCFGAKEAHSAEALENNKASRKVSKCGYLFVSPGFDFNNPLDRTKRWQRRFFILYDDGELTYSVDENPDTVPQGAMDMNKCTDVLDAEKTTTHTYSLSIITPEKTLYIKGNSKEEIQWWHDILIEFPKALKAIKPRRKMPYLIMSNKENMQPDGSMNGKGSMGDNKTSYVDVDKLKIKTEAHAYATFRGVRSLKHKYDTNHQEGLRKSSSLHDLSTEDKDMSNRLESSRFLSRSGDRLDMMSRDSTFTLAGSNNSVSLPLNPYCTIPKSTWTRTGQPIPSSFISPGRSHPPNTLASAQFNSSSSISSTSSTNSAITPHRRGSADDPSGSRASSERSSGRLHRERSSSLKDFPTQMSLARSLGEDKHQHQQQHGFSADETDSNETDELKMARSSSDFSQASTTGKYEDLAYMKKGWLIKQGSNEKESRKHWFVLTGNSLRYFKDAKSEECNVLDGRIDLTSCYEVSETSTNRNYGFKIKTRNGEYVLAAMTSGIRTNWMKAIRLFMEIHNSTSRQGTSITGPGRSGSKYLTASRTLDDFDLKAENASISTTAVKGAGGETAFQLVGRKDPYKRETQRPARRHHSDVNPGNVSKVFTIKEFTSDLDPSIDPLSVSGSSSHSTDSQRSSLTSSRAGSSPARTETTHPTGIGSSQVLSRMSRFVEGSDSLPVTITSSVSGQESNEQKGRLKQRPVTSESTKEEVNRAMMRRAKSPSARVREKSRASKSPRLTSPISISDGTYRLSSSAVDSVDGPTLTDMSMSEDEYPVGEETDHEDVASAATTTDVGSDDALVDILEQEVESLKGRLEHTQTELDKVHKDNKDLKSRYQKDSNQSLDSGYSTSSSRWSQGSTQPETLKRQLKESKDTVQRQRLDIESLKSKLDMSVSKLTGTEKALSEALREYKQEKDKFLKLSTEWNRRIRTLESNSKENVLKLERSRENLQSKERECRRLEVEMKSTLQRSREQEKEVLKLKAVEHEYNQLKEKLDDREHDISSLRSELKEKEHICANMKNNHERQLEEMDREFCRERDDMEHHIEQLKNELYHAHDRQTSMTDNMTSNMADICSEKDDIIAQLEEKMIEADKKLDDLSDEFQAEMGENADLAHTIELLQEEKIKLVSTIDSLEGQLVGFQSKVSGLQNDNFSLRKQLEELRSENLQLHQRLEGESEEDSQAGQEEQEALKKTIINMNDKITHLETKLQDAESMLAHEHSGDGASSSSDSQQDLLHNILLVDSQLKDVNSMLLKLRQNFDAYLNSIPSSSRSDAIKLANLIEDIGHQCQDIQGCLQCRQQNVPTGDTYKHDIRVNAHSGNEVIMTEYQGLKSKFDVVTNEARKIKKDYESVKCSYESVGKENSKLREDLGMLEGVLKPQVVDLISKVNNLSAKIVNVQTDATKDSPLTNTLLSSSSSSSVDVAQNIEQHVKQINSKICALEQQVVSAGEELISSQKSTSSSLPSSAAVTPSAEHEQFMLKLEDINQQVEDVCAKFGELNHVDSKSGKDYLTQLGDCKERIVSLSKTLKSLVVTKASAVQKSEAKEASQVDSTLAAEGLSSCLCVIKERIQEVGELLDSLEEDGEDSDSEDGGEQSGVEDVREKLSSLTEYIEQHSRMSTSEWAILRLLHVQKSHLCSTKDVIDSESVDDEEKLNLYCDRLSLEAVILSEMANLIQDKDLLSTDDPVSKELDMLNSQVLLLHYQLDNETRTMHFDLPQADLMESYTQLMAEKILVNGQLYANSLEENPDAAKGASSDTTSPPPLQPVLLASEALVRSQIDSYIGENLDRSAEEILTLPTHLTSRALVQGDLSYALSQLKCRLNNNPEVAQPGQSNYEFIFRQLEDRQRKVMESLEQYEKQLIHSLAVIIWKESEEMTIVDVPESVLDAMCSELSTIMETHIQRYKEMCRTTTSPHTARKYDIIVNEIRLSREATLTKIKRHYDAYSKDQTSIRDSSLDVPFQSLDDSINNFGEILSLKAFVKGSTAFLSELLKMGNAVLKDIDLEQLDDSKDEEGGGQLEKNLANFVNHLSEALKVASSSKAAQCKKILTTNKTQDNEDEDKNSGLQTESTSEDVNVCDLVRRMPNLSLYPEHLTDRTSMVVREAVFSAQLTFSMLKMKLAHDRDMSQVKRRRPTRSKPQADGEESRDSEDTLDLQTDYEALLMPLEEVLECKHVDEVEVLQVLLSQVNQMRADIGPSSNHQAVGEQLQLLEQKLHHELEVAGQRHKTHLEVFKQETTQLEKSLEEQQQDRDHFEERCLQLEEEMSALQAHHEEDKERMKQDILTAVHAIKSNDEKSETQLMEKASKLNKELAVQKLSFKRILSALRNEVATKEKKSVCKVIDSHISAISLTEEEEEEDYQPPLPEQPPPDMVDGAKAIPSLEQSLSASDLHTVGSLDMSHHEQEVEQLKKEKEEALAEEMRNTKAALDAMRKAYEEELVIEKSKYKEALVTMYTEEYVNEIRHRHQEEEDGLCEELQKLNMHYSSKCEDYKLMEIRRGQTKQDYESHIEQLITSNTNLEQMLNREIDSIKDFIKNKPSLGSLTTGSATVEEELYDAKIMVRVKDAELQKLRAQVKTQENNLQRTTEEQRQTMTLYMQSLKNAGETKKQLQEEIQQLTEKLNKVLGSQGLKANIKRTPSFHQRARSPSPQPSASPRKDSDHSSRDAHRRRHIQPKDLRRSKSSPSLPYVFDGKGVIIANKPTSSKSSRRSRSPKS